MYICVCVCVLCVCVYVVCVYVRLCVRMRMCMSIGLNRLTPDPLLCQMLANALILVLGGGGSPDKNLLLCQGALTQDFFVCRGQKPTMPVVL